jgi:hypothetical protein
MVIHLLKHDVCVSYFIYENEKVRTEGHKLHETYCMLFARGWCAAPPIVYYSLETQLHYLSHIIITGKSELAFSPSIALLMWWQQSILSFT